MQNNLPTFKFWNVSIVCGNMNHNILMAFKWNVTYTTTERHPYVVHLAAMLVQAVDGREGCATVDTLGVCVTPTTICDVHRVFLWRARCVLAFVANVRVELIDKSKVS